MEESLVWALLRDVFHGFTSQYGIVPVILIVIGLILAAFGIIMNAHKKGGLPAILVGSLMAVVGILSACDF